MDKNLYELVLKGKNNDNFAVEKLILRFEKLIKKYAYMLDYEDAQHDLILHFLKVIKNITLNENMKNEPILISYLCKLIRNEYIRLSKDKTKFNIITLNLDIYNENTINQL